MVSPPVLQPQGYPPILGPYAGYQNPPVVGGPYPRSGGVPLSSQCVYIRPVMVQQGPHPWGPMVQQSPATMAAAKNLTHPFLKEGRGNEFIIAFQAYLDKLEAGQPPSDDHTRLNLMEASLLPCGKAELQRRREEYQRGEGPPLSYASFWAWD